MPRAMKRVFRSDLTRRSWAGLTCNSMSTPAATSRPAQVLGLGGKIGTLAAGSAADLCALRWNASALPLVDTEGATRPGGCWEPIFVMRAGEVAVGPS